MKQIKILSIILLILGSLNVSNGQDSTDTNAPVQVISSEPFYYCTLEMTGSYEQHPEAFMRLMNFCSNNNIEFEPAGIYWNSPDNTKTEDLKWELGVMIPSEMKVEEPFKVKKWEYTLNASAEYDGVYNSEGEGRTVLQIFKWINDNGYTTSGPLVIRYLNQPIQTSEGQWAGKLQIMVPIQKKM